MPAADGDADAFGASSGSGAASSSTCAFADWAPSQTAIPFTRRAARVGSSARIMSMGLAPVGLFIGGVLLDAICGSTTILLANAVSVLVSFGGAISGSLRRAVQGTQ
jgi:hypothetical protein